MAFSPKRQEIEKFLGPNALKEWVDALVKLAPVLCECYSFSRLQWVHFIGQVAAETNGLSLRHMEENMNYTSAARIIEIFSYRLRLCIEKVNSGQVSEPKIAKGSTVQKLAQACVRNPTLLANIVYGGRDGTPWMQGARYKGRGPLQTTHLNNYRKAGEEVAKQPGGGKYDLVKNPELLSTDPELGVRVAFAEWKLKGLGIWAERDDVDVVSDILNTGNHKDNIKPHNLNGRRRWVAKAKVIWPAEKGGELPKIDDEIDMVINGVRITRMLREGCEGDDVEALQLRLRDLGYFTGVVDKKFGTLTGRAVRAFQSEHGLEDDGVVGPKTAEALNNTAPADLGERETVTAKDMKKRGSRIVTLTQRAKRLIEWLFGGSIAAILDSASGIGVVENALSIGERLKSVVTRVLDLVAGGHSGLLLTALGIAALCGVAWWAFDRIEKYRVEDAQTGAHLGK